MLLTKRCKRTKSAESTATPMKIYLRPLAPGETDFELIWFWLMLVSGSLGFFWLHWHLPLPECPMVHWTGLPCPTCGGTRMARAVLDKNFRLGFVSNPLLFFAMTVAAGVFAYSAVVLGMRLRRIRCGKLAEKFRYVIRSAAAISFVANWAYLIFTLPVGLGRPHSDKTRADFHGRGAVHGDILQT